MPPGMGMPSGMPAYPPSAYPASSEVPPGFEEQELPPGVDSSQLGFYDYSQYGYSGYLIINF